MKSQFKIPAVIALSILFCGLASAQVFDPQTGRPLPQQAQPGARGPAPTFDPTTGAAIYQPNQPGAGGPAMAIDPATGLPVNPSADSDWKDSNWKDPDIVIKDVNFDGIAIVEVANYIRDQFKGEFDIILPGNSGEGAINQLNGMPVGDIDWKNSITVQLRLKNVTASELFNAMNLMFANDATPLKWELKVYGHRQIALLRTLVNQVPNAVSPPKHEVRKVYFVGDLIGDQKSGGMTMEQIIKTITDVWTIANANERGASIRFHEDAQLLVVTGSQDQIDFMEQTLNALKQKKDLEMHKEPPQLKTK